MKILILANNDIGLYQFRRELIQELLKDNNIYISLPYGKLVEPLKEMGCQYIDTPIDRRGINPLTDIKLIIKYIGVMREIKPDMVITYTIKPNVYGGAVCRLLNIPYAVNITGLGTAFQKQPLASIVSIMYKIALKKAKTVFFENHNNAELFIDRKIIPNNKATILPGAGVNLDYYSYIPYSENEKVRFLYLGRIMKEKGMDELFYAIRKLYEKYGDKVQLDLVGFFEDEYKETVDKLESDGIVVFHGYQEDPRPFYANSDCVVLPSYHEGMSNVLLEAAATGRCIITSDIPGCREAVDDGVTGFLCAVQDKESLYEKMEAIVETSKEQIIRYGENGRCKMQKEFKKELVVCLTKDSIMGNKVKDYVTGNI